MAPDPADTVLQVIRESPQPLPLRGRVQPYAWGGHSYLRELTGHDLPPGTPAAEWWVGAHPIAPAMVVLGDVSCPLDALIAREPDRILGEPVNARFGGCLPFLLKVLDVRQMLSIQAHPTKAQAERGFAREIRAGVPLDAPTRSYKDDNHKPEAQVALTDFWLLYGFKPANDVEDTLGDRLELHGLGELFARTRRDASWHRGPKDPIKRLYEHIMRLPQAEIDELLAPLVTRLRPRYRDHGLDRDSPDFWAARAAEQFSLPGGHHDRGILSIYLLNLLHLRPGEGTYLGAGLLHAYLEGAAVEIMASSDNVLRGGLTPKHVDVEELLQIVSFDPVRPKLLETVGENASRQRYRTPAPEFALSRIHLHAGDTAALGAATGPEALVVVEGHGALRSRQGELAIARGSATLIPAGLSCTMRADIDSVAFVASVPFAGSR